MWVGCLFGRGVYSGVYSAAAIYSAAVTYSATRSLSPLAAEKWAYFFAGIWMVSPVAGLRPLRAARDLVENVPKPKIDT